MNFLKDFFKKPSPLIMQQRLYTKHLESALLAEQELIAVKCELEMATSRLAYHKSCVKAFAQ